MKHTITIRLGAAYWDATVATDKGTAHFDIRSMNRQQKGQFFSALRDAAQAKYGAAR